jgi:hypothetical protein
MRVRKIYHCSRKSNRRIEILVDHAQVRISFRNGQRQVADPTANINDYPIVGKQAPIKAWELRVSMKTELVHQEM